MKTLAEAYAECEKIARMHYENFPVGWFVPKNMRKHVYAIYAFARTADDYSDEAAYDGQRNQRLEAFEREFDEALEGREAPPLLMAVAESVDKTGIPQKLLKDLLVAFRMDITKKRYRNYAELENYCVYSANPVGRIVLQLFGYRDPELLRLSDRICTGIQLVNHWQDIGVDLTKDRVYLPEEDLARFRYSYEDLFASRVNDHFRALMRFEISRTRSLFYEGRALLGSLERRLKWQVSLMWMGPMEILSRIETANYDVFHRRPKLSKRDILRLAVTLPFRKSL